MSVKFEFTLSDIDAANLIGVLHSAQANALGDARKKIEADSNEVEIGWFNKHADYIGELIRTVASGSKRV